MKTKTMALSLMLTFASCALFAQTNTDSIPNDNPKTDSIPQEKTQKDSMPTASATFDIMQKTNLSNYLKTTPADEQWMKNEAVYSFIPAKETDLV